MTGPQHRRVLALNAGSSSLKAAVFGVADGRELLLIVGLERIGSRGARIRVRDGGGATLAERTQDIGDYGAALSALFGVLGENDALKGLIAVGHRIVHGGAEHWQPERVTPALLGALRKLVPLAPDHMPQVACFDTAFQRTLPAPARTFALPRTLYDEGIVRYGFHGLSYESIMQQLGSVSSATAQGRVLVAHLGNGASIAAIAGGRCVDTTMGYTPNSGLVMGTRSGDVDPGVLLHLLTERGMTPQALQTLLDDRSGLLGVSGTSADMRDLLAAEATDSRAADAIVLFCYRAKKYLGAFAAVLGGLDTLVFTGGIGEKAAPVRERICAGLEFLGIELDPVANRSNAPVISTQSSAVAVRVLVTNEEAMIARATIGLVGAHHPRSQNESVHV